MACLIAPTTAAVAATIIKKKTPTKYHFEWLLLMLWGGTIMLILDHAINGEIVPYYPFLTAGFSQIILEILKVGVPMVVGTVLAWAGMVWASFLAQKRAAKSLVKEEA